MTLFPKDFPLVNSSKVLEEVKNKYPKYDPYFVASGCIKVRREKFNSLWTQFKHLLDKEKTRIFLSKIKQNGQFHENTWEMYLGCVLANHLPKVTTSPKDKGIDFMVSGKDGDEIFIEAVACKKGSSDDAVPDMVVSDMKNVSFYDVPHDEMLLRLSNSIDYKAKQYKDFIGKIKKPYIIAINKGALEHVEPDKPLVLKCLFGLGYQQINITDGKPRPVTWSKREFIEKKNGEKISMTFFEKEENNFVSAVIYCSENILNSPNKIGSDCILVHNPKARFPIDTKTFSFLDQWKSESVGNGLEIKKI